MNGVSRRAVLGAGALAVAAEPFASVGGAAAATTSDRRLYRRARFEPLVGRSFRLDGRTVRLAAVVGDERCFSLRFTAGRRGGLEQGTYSLRRAGFDDTVLLVVPIDAAGRTYEAIINSG